MATKQYTRLQQPPATQAAPDRRADDLQDDAHLSKSDVAAEAIVESVLQRHANWAEVPSDQSARDAHAKQFRTRWLDPLIGDPGSTAAMKRLIDAKGGPENALDMTRLSCSYAFDAMRASHGGDSTKAWLNLCQAQYWLGMADAFHIVLSKPEVLHKQVSSANGKAGGAPRTVDHAAVKRFHSRMSGEYDPTSLTAAEFGISTRTVRKIIRG
jgi:hypothetical protein